MNIFRKKLYLSFAVIFLAVFLLSGCSNRAQEAVDQPNEKEAAQPVVESQEQTKEPTTTTKEESEKKYQELLNKVEEQKQELSRDGTKGDEIKQGLINKYQAVDISEIKPGSSLEISKKIGQNKIFLNAELQDVYIKGNKYFIRIESSLFGNIFSDSIGYIAELECSKDVANYFIDNKDVFSPFGKDFFVIAEINEVSKPSFELSASPTSGEETVIKSDSSEDTFIFKGKLIDFRLGEERLP